jgi:cytochrome c peroxidase
MKVISTTACSVLVLGAAFYSCQTEELKSKKQEQEFVLDLPTYPLDYGLMEGNDLPTLGRVLFYDPRLSINNTVSCSSCHIQALAFTDQATFSTGFEKKVTTRNSMPIQNIVADSFQDINNNGFTQPTALFWDGRQRRLEDMVLEPIKNHIEMGTTDLNQLAKELSQIGDYQRLFAKAFPMDGSISPEKIGRALAAFLVSIKSKQSKFDQFLAGNNSLTPLEMEGRALFFDKYDCNSCHQLQAPVNGYQLAGFGDFGGFADIGLDEQPADPGVLRVSGNEADKGKFKIPSLRNVALTAPYMHDGRFETLEEVIDHYSEGIDQSENLDVRLREVDGAAKQFHISAAERQAIVAFMNSMTDLTMIHDPKFSNPFKSN